MHPIVNIAVRAARRAGNVLLRNLDRVDDLDIGVKGVNDFVTEVDRLAEREIIEVIRRSYPDHAILAEESGPHPGDEHCWVVDPLDGTTNYIHRFPHFCISIAVKYRGRVEHGLVYDPLREELFTATRGGGAMLDNRRIRASRREHLEQALIGTGLAPACTAEELAGHHEIRRALGPGVGLRRSGSAALDLAYVAAGRLDGYWELGLAEWDIAAGALLARESGAMVSAADGSDDYLARGDVVAANPRLFRPLLRIVHRVSCRADGTPPAGHAA